MIEGLNGTDKDFLIFELLSREGTILPSYTGKTDRRHLSTGSAFSGQLILRRFLTGYRISLKADDAFC